MPCSQGKFGNVGVPVVGAPPRLKDGPRRRSPIAIGKDEDRRLGFQLNRCPLLLSTNLPRVTTAVVLLCAAIMTTVVGIIGSQALRPDAFGQNFNQKPAKLRQHNDQEALLSFRSVTKII